MSIFVQVLLKIYGMGIEFFRKKLEVYTFIYYSIPWDRLLDSKLRVGLYGVLSELVSRQFCRTEQTGRDLLSLKVTR